MNNLEHLEGSLDPVEEEKIQKCQCNSKLPMHNHQILIQRCPICRAQGHPQLTNEIRFPNRALRMPNRLE